MGPRDISSELRRELVYQPSPPSTGRRKVQFVPLPSIQPDDTDPSGASSTIGSPSLPRYTRSPWMRWTVALWLTSVAALPWLQWAMSIWRGSMLRAEVYRLRWWALTLRRSALRIAERRRMQRWLELWSFNASRARAGRRKAAQSTMSQSNDSSTFSLRQAIHTGAVNSRPGIAPLAPTTTRLERVAQAAWSGLAHQLAIFVAWVGVMERSRNLEQ